MERIIKFRGKRIDNGQWVYGDLLQYRVLPVIFDSNKEQHECDYKSIGQFTGLLDRQGKEIYEGDIIKGGIYNSYFVAWDYEDNGWNIKPFSINHYEIIGNIYEPIPVDIIALNTLPNSELLKD